VIAEEIKKAAADLVQRTCREQGLSEKVEDAATVSRIAAMIKSDGGRRAAA
jgi:hypothetical protein